MWVSVMRRWVKYRRAFQILFFVVVAVGMFLGMRPTPPPAAYSWMMSFYHLGGLFGCTVLSYLAFPRWKWWFRGVAMFGVGVMVELVQSFHPNRVTDMEDMLANSAGVALGLILIAAWKTWSSYRRHGLPVRSW